MTLKSLRGRFRGAAVPAAGLILLLAVWQVVGVLEVSPAIPRLDRVAAAFVDILGQDRFHEAVVSTAMAIVIGYPLAAVIGLVIGVAMGMVRVVEWALTPYLYFALSVPLIVIIPVILLIFGLGRTSVIVIIVAYVVPLIVANTMAGVQSVDAQLKEMTTSFGAGPWLTVRRLTLPASLSLILSGMRIGAGRAIEGAVLGEQLVGLIGLGGLVMRLGGAFAVEDLFAVVIFIGLVGVGVVSGVNRLERRWSLPS
ncbi:ABC transporter permease [Mycobacterium sp. NAZ190054]|uniref:ABC transporter permease n=1 Tax=Mycobacterium sp. NAZ190054 TaxID=1747766 RepID=UPI000791B4AE|nr:ABC transporter permease subunit [Mycobacterium sp. NAZ190054]KWX57142.1 hypothetical protein ASJ79_12350 [Mycobacterium sp. NAZ190054]